MGGPRGRPHPLGPARGDELRRRSLLEACAANRELLLRLLLFRPRRHPQTSFPPPSLPRPRPPVPPPLVPPLLLRRRHRRARVLQWRPPLTALADARPSMEAANERIKKIAALKDECVLKRTELAAKYQAWRGVWPGKDSKDMWLGRTGSKGSASMMLLLKLLEDYQLPGPRVAARASARTTILWLV